MVCRFVLNLKCLHLENWMDKYLRLLENITGRNENKRGKLENRRFMETKQEKICKIEPQIHEPENYGIILIYK